MKNTGIQKGQEKQTIGDFDCVQDKLLIQQTPLLQIHFARIVLDEGHVIKNPTNLTALTVSRLRADCRWILTATPLHNSPDDLFSQMRFLRIHPFNEIDVSCLCMLRFSPLI